MWKNDKLTVKQGQEIRYGSPLLHRNPLCRCNPSKRWACEEGAVKSSKYVCRIILRECDRFVFKSSLATEWMLFAISMLRANLCGYYFAKSNSIHENFFSQWEFHPHTLSLSPSLFTSLPPSLPPSLTLFKECVQLSLSSHATYMAVKSSNIALGLTEIKRLSSAMYSAAKSHWPGIDFRPWSTMPHITCEDFFF